nr:retrotransposon Orf1 [Tanacetum cinerariifolium]
MPRLCGEEHVLTLSEFAVLLGLYEQSELRDRVFAVYFNKLEINDKGFDHNSYWRKIGKPTKTNKRSSLVKDPLMRITHRLLVRTFVHITGRIERSQKLDLWLMSSLENGHFVNVAWVIALYLCKSGPRIKENNDVCGGHYVTKIARSLGYLLDKEVNKCLDPIECEEWAAKHFIKEFDMQNMHLK